MHQGSNVRPPMNFKSDISLMNDGGRRLQMQIKKCRKISFENVKKRNLKCKIAPIFSIFGASSTCLSPFRIPLYLRTFNERKKEIKIEINVKRFRFL